MAWLVDDQTPATPSAQVAGDTADREDAVQWFRPTRRALLAPLGVGTVDQALLAAMHVRFGVLRLLGLAGSVLIVDEVHAYDAYMSRILSRLLGWCARLGTPVILLSATLPACRKAQLVEAYRRGDHTAAGADWREPGAGGDQRQQLESDQSYPLITVAPSDASAEVVRVGGFACRPRPDVHLVCHEGVLEDAQATARLVGELVEHGGCVAVVVNTIGSAQAVYQHVQASVDAAVVCDLFHARYPAHRRTTIEQRVLDTFGREAAEQGRRPQRTVLIATQVIEQSLDLDFDVMVSELAPVDLLVQRAGRLRRHEQAGHHRGGHADPVLHLLTPAASTVQPGGEMGGTEHVYDRFILLKTLATLAQRDRLRQPEDLRNLIESVYDGSPDIAEGCGIEPAAVAEALTHWEEREQAMATSARRFLVPAPMTSRLAMAANAPFDEQDREAANFFHARTRYGAESQQVVLLEDPTLLAAVDIPEAPSTPWAQLHGSRASVPRSSALASASTSSVRTASHVISRPKGTGTSGLVRSAARRLSSVAGTRDRHRRPANHPTRATRPTPASTSHHVVMEPPP